MGNNIEIEYNRSRIDYLLALYNMSEDGLLSMLNEGMKNPYTKKNISGRTIKESILKKIGKIFNKDIYFFIDFSELKINSASSIFFRKNNFATQPNMEARRIVCHYEDLKNTISAYCKLGKFQFQRKLKKYTTNDSAKEIAFFYHDILFTNKRNKAKEMLKILIDNLAEANVYVFEYIEHPNKKEKSNIDGFFLRPNIIVLKRQQKAFNREIFTLAHEFGHYLLDYEDMDELDDDPLTNNHHNNSQEKWCNEFAFHFIAGKEISSSLDNIHVDTNNDYEEVIENIAKTIHLSQSAIYTHLYLNQKMTFNVYNVIKLRLNEELSDREAIRSAERPKSFSQPKPIQSNLFIKTMQLAYYKGVVGDMEFCSKLHIESNQMDKYLE